MKWRLLFSIWMALALAALLGHGSQAMAQSSAVAWGFNGFGQLGDGTTTDKLTPVRVRDSKAMTSVKAGSTSAHSLAIRWGTVFAWGANSSGQLGDGTFTNRVVPVPVVGPFGGFFTNVAVVAGGGAHSLAIRANGRVFAWGSNSSGQLGDGSGVDQSMPVTVASPGGIGEFIGKAVAAGQLHSLALKSDGTVFAWGNNTNGQLGDGTAGGLRSTPVQVVSPEGIGFLTGVVAIAAGEAHSLALKADGTVLAWGDNTNGQLGNGTTGGFRSTPGKVVGRGGIGFLTWVVAIAAGGGHGLALKPDGTVFAWGDNTNGQLGDGTTISRHLPVPVRRLKGVTTIAAGALHSLAITIKSRSPIPDVLAAGE